MIFILKQQLCEVGVTCLHSTEKKIATQKGQVARGYTGSKRWREDLNLGLASLCTTLSVHLVGMEWSLNHHLLNGLQRTFGAWAMG